jgi:hypothetical protein
LLRPFNRSLDRNLIGIGRVVVQHGMHMARRQ